MEASTRPVRLLAVVGPTAVGKSALAIKLAETLKGEIIGADSRQVYRHMDIGTAKPSPADRARVRHHLVDVVDPAEQFGLASYLDLAKRSITNTSISGKIPILVGGTGQYIDVSLQEALITYYTDAHPALAWMQMGENVTRVGHNSTLVIPLGAYPSKDGWISAGIITPREWDALAEWIFEVTGNEEVLNEDYKGGNQDRAPHNDMITALVIDFTTRFTSEYLFHEGQRRNLVFIPVNTVSDLLADPQLEASNFWFDLEHAETGSLKYPLGVYDSEEVSPATNPAPRLGQDNDAIYSGELGISPDELASLTGDGVI